jgi:hypothetical protein
MWTRSRLARVRWGQVWDLEAILLDPEVRRNYSRSGLTVIDDGEARNFSTRDPFVSSESLWDSPGLPKPAAEWGDVTADPGAQVEQSDSGEMKCADRDLEDFASAVDEAGAVAAITLSLESNVSTIEALVEPGSSSCSTEPPKLAVPRLPSSLQRAVAMTLASSPLLPTVNEPKPGVGKELSSQERLEAQAAALQCMTAEPLKYEWRFDKEELFTSPKPLDDDSEELVHVDNATLDDDDSEELVRADEGWIFPMVPESVGLEPGRIKNWKQFPADKRSSIYCVGSHDDDVYTTILDPSAIDKKEQVNTQWIKVVAPDLVLSVSQPYAVLFKRAGNLAKRIDDANKTRINQSKNSDPESPAAVPTSTAPTSTVPTSTAPTSTAPTSTAPTSTVPTSNPKKKRARRRRK